MKKKLDKTSRIIEKIIKQYSNKSFVYALEYFYENSQDILYSQKKWKKIKLSSGTSSVDIFSEYKKAICKDIDKGVYKKYGNPSGDDNIRYCLAKYYNLYLGRNTFNKSDFCLTDGATGAISSFFEWYSACYPNSEVLITTPSYYIFKLECQKYSIAYNEFFYQKINNQKKVSFYNYNAIKKSINSKTKLIVITNPANPTGDTLKNKEVLEIIRYAKKKNIILLIDSLFLSLDMENKNAFSEKDPFLIFGHKENYLDNIFIVQGWSKDRNIPGFRAGYIFSKNIISINNITSIQESKSFFAPASNIKTMVILDIYIRYLNMYFAINKIYARNKKIILIKKLFLKDKIINSCLRDINITDAFFEFECYNKKVIDFYEHNRQLAISLLKDKIEAMSNNHFAFNIFLKLKLPNKVNLFDFSTNLFIKTGVKIQTGPYFGFNQYFWENLDNDLWLRISYGCKSNDLKIGLKKLILFIENYEKEKKNNLRTNIIFK